MLAWNIAEFYLRVSYYFDKRPLTVSRPSPLYTSPIPTDTLAPRFNLATFSPSPPLQSSYTSISARMAAVPGPSTAGIPIPHRTPQRRKGLRESLGDKGAPINLHRIQVDSGMDGYHTVISKHKFLEMAKGRKTKPPREQYLTPKTQGMNKEDCKKPEKSLYHRLVRPTVSSLL